MSLSLKIFTRATGQSKFVSERVFEEERITVGRNTTCTLALDDPDRCLSRVHAELVKTGKSYMLKVLSGTSPVIVNGEPYTQGSEVMVRPGDILAMDVYDLQVASVAEAGPDPEATMAGRAPSATLAARVAAASRTPPADTGAAPDGAGPSRGAGRPPRPGCGPRGRKKWLVVGGAVVAGVVALTLALPALKGLVPDSEAQKKADLRIAQLDGEARSLLKLVEGDRRDLKEAVAGSRREIEKAEAQLRSARTSQERIPLEAALREAERQAKVNTALENKVRDQSEGPNGLPKAEGNLVAAATAAKGKDKADAVKLLEETVAALTAVRAKIAEDRKLAQAEDERSRGELQSGAKAEADARAKMEIEARARAEAEVKAKLEREARARAEADAAKAAAKGAPPAEPQMSKAALAAQAAQEAKAAKAAAAQAAQDAKAAKTGQAAKAAQDAAAAKAAQDAAAAKAAQDAQAAKAAQEAQAARAAQAAQAAQAAAAQVAASPCLAKLSGAWSHAVGGTWRFAGSQGTLVVNSSNYGASAQQITAINVSSCENDTVTYKVVRLALVNPDDPKLAYDKTPANEPALSTWAKVNTQRYAISAGGLRFGNYTFAKR